MRSSNSSYAKRNAMEALGARRIERGEGAVAGPQEAVSGLALDIASCNLPRQVDAGGTVNSEPGKTNVVKVPSLRIEIVKRSDDMKGFVLLPRRWVVERTFSWLGRNRRLAKDWKNLATTLQAFVALASIQIAIGRLAR